MLEFKSVSWRNFLSYGENWTTIPLNAHATTILTGKNGAGKSTFMDALSYGLYGKPMRDVRVPTLINSVNRSGMEVRVVFKRNGIEFQVIRGLNPRVFEIYRDGTLIEQDSTAKDYQNTLTNILGFSHKAFSQIVVLGSRNYTPFMQLTAADRREVIEDLLDIRVFTIMGSILKDRRDELEETYDTVTSQIDTVVDKMEVQKKFLDHLNTRKEEAEKKKQTELADLEKKYDDAKARFDALQESTDKINEALKELAPKKKRLDKLRELEVQLTERVRRLNDQIKFFDDNDMCPKCMQPITEDIRHESTQSIEEKLEEINEGIAKLHQQIEDLEVVDETLGDFRGQLEDAQRQADRTEYELSLLDESITSKKEDTSSEDTPPDLGYDLDDLEANLNEATETLKVLKEQKALYTTASTLLKDTGIKAKVIQQYIPIINQMINKYLAMMDFFVLFELDENFKEQIRSRYRDEFQYASFSEGQKMRIDLALLLTWRAIAKMKNSASTNLLIMDEIFDASMDQDGVDEMVKIVNTLSEDQNCFIISHADHLIDKFHHSIAFTLTQNFSVMEERTDEIS